MRFIDEYRNSELANSIVKRIWKRQNKPVKFMEFCGGHTFSIMKHGLRQMLPSTIEMLSGPGCPVCVTPNSDLDKAIAIAMLPDIIVTTFGDMLRVPGSYGSLSQTKANGADVRIVYSTTDALSIARRSPSKAVVFIGIGFETTAPVVAASILQAYRENLENYFVLSLHKLCPPIMKALLDTGDVKLDGIICPGHVSAIIGSAPYNFLPLEYRIASVISGFEPLDILLCIDMLLEQLEKGMPSVEIAYPRVVNPEGNRHAIDIMYEVFEPCKADWRGIGSVPNSGLRIKEDYSRFDVERSFHLKLKPARQSSNCICGDILRGVKTPQDCKLFKLTCTPISPIGPCMVSSEGTCSAYYKFGDQDG